MPDSSVHSVTRGAMPDASVPRATSTPTTRTSWCGFGSFRRFTCVKLLRTGRPLPFWRDSPATIAGRPRRMDERSQVAGVLLAEAARQAGEQLLREAGELEQLVERPLPELGQLEVGVGDHAGVARGAVEEGEVAEEGAGAEGRHLAPVALDPGPPVEDHEELGAGGSLAHDRLAGRDRQVVGRLRHHLQFLL